MNGECRPKELRARSSFIAELILILALAIAAFFWIIPAQVSGGGMGLDPGVLPRVCVAAIAGLVLLDGLKRLLTAERIEAYEERWTALLIIIALAVLGAFVMQLAGLAVSALVTIPIGMLLLGERRPLLIIATTLLVAGPMLVLQR